MIQPKLEKTNLLFKPCKSRHRAQLKWDGAKRELFSCATYILRQLSTHEKTPILAFMSAYTVLSRRVAGRDWRSVPRGSMFLSSITLALIHMPPESPDLQLTAKGYPVFFDNLYKAYLQG